MATTVQNKKRVVISYKNLSEELQAELKKAYPAGFTDKMIRIDKGPGDFFYAVTLETEEYIYLVKIDVKIDTKVEEEEEKGYYDDDHIEGADEINDEENDEE